jgi:hypothetical protein
MQDQVKLKALPDLNEKWFCRHFHFHGDMMKSLPPKTKNKQLSYLFASQQNYTKQKGFNYLYVGKSPHTSPKKYNYQGFRVVDKVFRDR